MLPDWDHCFPNCPPLGHRLRLAFPARWVRFHSLPGSKRYPENESEYAEVLARHNIILGELTDPEHDVVLVTTEYSESPSPINPNASLWRTIPMHEAEDEFDEPNYWHLYTSIRVWRPGEFDPLVRLIAADAMADVLIVAPDCRWVLHPYDGGMDVLSESPQACRTLRERHLAWLSAREDGM